MPFNRKLEMTRELQIQPDFDTEVLLRPPCHMRRARSRTTSTSSTTSTTDSLSQQSPQSASRRFSITDLLVGPLQRQRSVSLSATDDGHQAEQGERQKAGTLLEGRGEKVDFVELIRRQKIIFDEIGQ